MSVMTANYNGRMRPAACLLFALSLYPAPPSASDRLPAKRKIDLIEAGKAAPGSQVAFQEPELNSYIELKSKEIVPEGFRNPRLKFGENRATGTALVDFVKIKHAQGEDLGWLMKKMLEGEHEVTVTGRLESKAGVARVDIDEVQIGGSSIRGRTLDLLIRTFVNPLYPAAKVGQSFELGYNMDRIELKPGLAVVTMAPKQPWRKAAEAQPAKAPVAQASRPAPAR